VTETEFEREVQGKFDFRHSTGNHALGGENSRLEGICSEWPSHFPQYINALSRGTRRATPYFPTSFLAFVQYEEGDFYGARTAMLGR